MHKLIHASLLFATLAIAKPITLSETKQIQGRPLELPPVGAWSFRVLAPTVLELRYISGQSAEWDIVQNGHLALPEPTAFVVTVDGAPGRISKLGFRRRMLYAPLGANDLRVDNRLFFVLQDKISDGATVVLRNPEENVWIGPETITAKSNDNRQSPALHINQVGYEVGFPKRGFVGYYLGTLGELEVPVPSFQIVAADTGDVVFSGPLLKRLEEGFEGIRPPYQHVYEADFSNLERPGLYVLRVPGLGQSWPFRIGTGAFAALARAYALGLYHQRCGTKVALPFTRFTHGPCHKAPAEVPTALHKAVKRHLQRFQQGVLQDSQVAPILDQITKALFPYKRKGKVDVSGGHHDAGDYSKYTINSAAMVHALVLAADAFPNVNKLDNLGIPDSGNGIPDLLDIARFEASFLAKMQDEDGGFYFLVYPRDRPYEADVLPEHGDPQVVFPKNTSATAAAVAALAQAGSSPFMRQAFPSEAENWLLAAKKGWNFLEKAWQKYGPQGAYQRVTHYGAEFGDKDEVIWAAIELLLATGEEKYREFLKRFDPMAKDTYQYGWVRLFEGYGSAVRSCALAEKTGRRGAKSLPEELRRRCREEMLSYAVDLVRFSHMHSYRVTLHTEFKRHLTAGWHFTHAYIFNLAAAYSLDPRKDFLDAMVSDFDYPLGSNPNNISYVTGLGYERLRDVVSAYALNDHRILPPSGIPVGDLIPGFGWIQGYGDARKALSFPSDEDPKDPYAFYDRFGDSWNTQAEATIVVMAQALAGASALMAMTGLTGQEWRCAQARILVTPKVARPGRPLTLKLEVDGLDVSEAFVVWDVPGFGVFVGQSLTLIPDQAGTLIVEAEAQWFDGRRTFAAMTLNVAKD